MKNKLKYLIKYSLKKKINTKWFKIVNLLLCILLVFIVNIDSIINLFGGDFNNKETIEIVDKVGVYDDFVKLYQEYSNQDYEIKIRDKEVNKDNIDDEIVVIIDKDDTNYLKGDIVSFNTVSRNTYDTIVEVLSTIKMEYVLESSGMSIDEINSLVNPPTISETVLNEEMQDNETKEELSMIITTVMIVPFFMLILTMVQMIGAEINDEKSSRGMEIIISSIPAKWHFISKVASAISFVLIQGLLMVAYCLLAILVRLVLAGNDSSLLGINIGNSNIISEIIKLMNDAGVFHLLGVGSLFLIILFGASFFAYAIISAVLASMTTNNEDFQQLQTPLMLIMFAGYYLALMAVVFDGSIIIKILAFVPLLSVMIAPTLYLIGDLSLLGLGISSISLLGIVYLLYKYGLRIYKVGILNYSSSNLWRKMFKSLKRSKSV